MPVSSVQIIRRLDSQSRLKMRVSQGFWGKKEHLQNIEGNKGKLANFWEQGNKIRKITKTIRYTK